MAVKNPSQVWKNTEGKASGSIGGKPHVPFSNFGQEQNQPQDQPDPQNQQERKKRSPIDDLNSVKSTINTARTIINVAKYAFNPWILVGIFIFIIIYMLFFGGGGSFGGGSSDSSQQQGTGTVPTSQLPPIPGLTINLTADAAVGNETPIDFTASYTYDPSKNNNIPLSQITLYDDIPPNTTFGTTNGKPTQNGNTVSWLLSDNPSPITFTLKPTSDDINVSNYVYAKSAGGGGNSGLPPSNNNCGDSGYQGFMDILPNHLNFGDPQCEVTSAYNNPAHRDLMYNYVKSLDPQNSVLWFYCIAYGESSWDPNAYLAASTSGYGAYGLFQMNPSGKGVNQYDAGDVDWRTQIQNAVNYNKEDNGQFDVFTGGGTVTSELYKDANGNFQCGHALGSGSS